MRRDDRFLRLWHVPVSTPSRAGRLWRQHNSPDSPPKTAEPRAQGTGLADRVRPGVTAALRTLTRSVIARLE
ncbi:hypothetical protein CKJ61_13440 [Mycobacterium intracellulare]|nr:hypothetical protein OCQ_25550 [Mycobacterium paraintracellulare]ASW85808.1 hypothetical protein CKJ61_13440 [Mycobacterium intracellulare]OSC25539.1 hypothetical protein B8W68_14105 [Mycobacterium paraintracellulare]